MRIIKRKHYLDKLIRVMGTPDIKVITGVRRSGKTELMKSFAKHIANNDTKANIIHINYSLQKFTNLRNHQSLYDYVSKQFQPSKNNYLLIDEVQMCSEFETVLNWLHAEEKYDIFITGSNAFLLSSDLATLFTGRTFPIEVYPFSFSEFMEYFRLKDTETAFDKYISAGGMAGAYLYPEEDRNEYLNDVANTLIIRDIINKFSVRNHQVLMRLLDFMMDNIANLLSPRAITNCLIESADHKTIGNYIDYLCNAFIFYKVQRFDVQGRKYLTTNDKYYLVDHGFKFARLGTKNFNYGRIIENIVAIELLRRGYEIYVGVLYKTEIDFVARKRNEQIYIQVAYNIDEEDTLNRELTPLLKIHDAYPKMIIARTHQPTYQKDGVTITDISEWLTK